MPGHNTDAAAWLQYAQAQAASKRFLTVHMLVPGDWTVHDAHHVAEDFEGEIRTVLGDAVISTHLEPVEDQISMDDIHEA